MADEIIRPQPDQIEETYTLTSPTFRSVVRRLRRLTTDADRAEDYSLGALAAEHGIALKSDEDKDRIVGRRWQYPPQSSAASPIRYEVTTYNHEAQQLLLERDFTKKLIASVWFETRLGNSEEGGEFSYVLEFLNDDHQDPAYEAVMSGQLRLGQDLTDEERNKLFTDADSAGAALVFDNYELQKSSPEPHDFFVAIPEEVGQDMIRAFGMLATQELLP